MSSAQVAPSAFVALLPITNPVGAVAASAGMTGSQPQDQVHRQAIMTCVHAAAILAVQD